MKAIPVGRSNVGLLYYVIDGETDGLVIAKNKKRTNVNFLSYLARTDVQRMSTSPFHEFLWDGVDHPTDKWRNMIEYRVQPIPEHMFAGAEVVSSFPKDNSGEKRVNEKDDRASEFKSLLASGNHEKALGRALRRGARNLATGGVRGFVRGASFDPRAEDADGDGWVQEGTQFARRATSSAGTQARRRRRVARAQDRYDSSDRIGMASRREWGPTDSQLRWKQRSKEHYKTLYDKQTKSVLDAFNDGKPIKTYDDLARALRRAHPGFRDGSSTATYLRGANPDAEVAMPEYEHAMAFMTAILANPDLKEVNFKIVAGTGESADGYIQYVGRHRLSRNANGVTLTAGKDKKLSLENMYKDEVSYMQVGNLQKFGNFQLETHKMFFSMLEDVEPLTTPDGRPNPDVTDADRQAWEEARAMAARSVTLHEMGHAVHQLVSLNDSMRAVGLDPDGQLTLADIRQRFSDAIDSMPDDEVVRAVMEMSATKVEENAAFIQIQLAVLSQSDPDLTSAILFGPLSGPDGNSDIVVGPELAKFLNSLPRSSAPNPTMSRWKEGDTLTFQAAMAIFDATPQQTNRPIFSDKTMPYFHYAPWNGRMIAPRQHIDPSDRTSPKIPIPQMHILIEHGLPRTPMTPAVPAEEMREVFYAYARVNEILKGIVLGFDRTLTPIRTKDRHSSLPLVDVIDGSVEVSDARDVLKKFANLEMDTIIDGLDQGMPPLMARQLLELYFISGKRLDDLNPQERAMVRRIAQQAAGGPWWSYMTTYSESEFGKIFGFKEMEMIAELVTANFLGNELHLTGDDGKPRPLSGSEKDVLKKIIGWLFPQADFEIG